uniref:Uncharacterized protein n=1 Tax=Arundo donax TaxID=35708 RepID=A0A0A9HNW0_ARUDO
MCMVFNQNNQVGQVTAKQIKQD